MKWPCEVLSDCFRRNSAHFPTMIRRITGIEVEAIRGMQRECQMYVLTNSSKIQGAACMFYPHVLEMIGEILKEDFYILPSSIHEVIILPKSREIDKRGTGCYDTGYQSYTGRHRRSAQ